MRLLITTQAVDAEDQALGFFVRWIEELAPRFESIEVICLTEGTYRLPANIAVHSLGKESGRKHAFVYALGYLALAWRLRDRYDASFVHMNQEYLLLAGWLWKLLGKPAYLWRNHYAGSWLTDVAAAFCTKVFCTSAHSYTAKYRKTVLMPVGVDTDRFFPDARITRTPRSILFLARIAPSKRPDVFIDALGLLIGNGISFVASVYGSPLPEHAAYYESLKTRAEALGLHDRVRFLPGVPNEQTPDIYRAYELFVNCSPSGMFDKTLFEAVASGCIVLAASADFADVVGDSNRFDAAEPADLERSLARTLSLPSEEAEGNRSSMSRLCEEHSLFRLGARLEEELSPAPNSGTV